MTLLLKAEIQFLRGNKQVSKEYEYQTEGNFQKNLLEVYRCELNILSPLLQERIIT